MAHFAKVEDSIVTQVVSIDNVDTYDADGNESEAVGIQFCNSFEAGTWVQTSYNGTIRKNYASIGYTYNTTLDAFISPSPHS